MINININPTGSGTVTDEVYPGYDILDYIQSSGTQYIKTNLTFNDFDKLEFNSDWSMSSDFATIIGNKRSENGTQVFIGGKNNGSDGGFSMYSYQWGTWYHNTNYYGLTTGVVNLVANQNITGTLNGTEFTYANTPYKASDQALIFTSIDNLGMYWNKPIRIYYLKLSNNNTLVRDFIPAKRLSDNAIGLLDKANNVFYTNAGSGTFSYGTVLGEYHKLTATKNSGYKFLNWTLNGYTQLDYIESTGTQWIDTGLSGKMWYDADFERVNSTAPTYFWGYNNETYYTRFALMHYGNIFHLEVGFSGCWNVPIDTNRHKLSLQGTKLVVDGNTYTAAEYETTQEYETFRLFGAYFTGTMICAQGMKLYSFKCYNADGTKLVRDYIPVIRHSDGSIGLYDLVTMQFFENKGTGSFIAGPNKEVN